MGRLYWRDVGLAMGCFLAITYVFCVGYDLVFVPLYNLFHGK